MTAGLGGAFVEPGPRRPRGVEHRVAPVESQGEDYKTGRILRSEREAKPSGGALVAWDKGPGRILVCSLNCDPFTEQHLKIVRAILHNLGAQLDEPLKVGGDLFDATGTLRRALVVGGFEAADHEQALATDWLDGETAARPRPGTPAGGLEWTAAEAQDDGVFDLKQLAARRARGELRSLPGFLVVRTGRPG